ncbi:MAG: hypothetical protein U5L45_25230 [Saprospiraceae bacterium]|nr:hypothetical protein [Saprospiraceae bacterium]
MALVAPQGGVTIIFSGQAVKIGVATDAALTVTVNEHVLVSVPKSSRINHLRCLCRTENFMHHEL